MTKKFVFRSNKYNITHQDIQKGIEDRGYVDFNPITSNQTNPLDKWYKYRAERSDQNIFPSSSINLTRIQIHDAVRRLEELLSTNVGIISAEKEYDLHVGYNFNKQKIYNYVEEYLLQNPSQVLTYTKDPQQFTINIADLYVKNILIYQGSKNNTNTTLPLLKTNIGEKVGHHKDGRFERGTQGPFTEAQVGGYKHRHQTLGKTSDRPERFAVTDDGTNIVFSSPISSASGLDYSIPYARYSRDGFIKSVVNIKNIRTSGSQNAGNFLRNYQLINGLNRRNQNLAFIARSTSFPASTLDVPYVSGVVEHTLPDRSLPDGTYNKSVFVNKFGAPGDINSTNLLYMDTESEEYSPYNTVNYRNSSPRKTLKLSLASGSYFGGFLSGSYNISASYQKQQRNNRYAFVSGSTSKNLRPDNGFINFQIPATNNGFLWVRNYLSSSDTMSYINNSTDNSSIFITSSVDGIGFSKISSRFYTFSGYTATISSSSLRNYILKFNGLWNYSSKQQLSNTFNNIVNYQNKNNIFNDEIFKVGSSYKQPVSTRDSFIKDKYTNTINAYEDSGLEAERLSYSFAQKYSSIMSNYYDAAQNKLDNFYKDYRNIKYNDKKSSLLSSLLKYDRITRNVSSKKIKEIVYEEKIYPRGQNAYRNFARVRNNYLQKWADSLDNRLTELTNSQGKVYTGANFNNSTNILNYSFWPLDANTYYDSVTPASRDKSGELLQLDNPALYATAIGSTYTITVPSGSYYGTRFGRNWNTNRPANVVHEQAGRGPYPSSYINFYSDIKNIGQGYSVIPEFRISPKLDYYYNNNTSYYDDYFNSLELTGTIIEDLSIAIDTGSAFIEQRVNSDYIDLNDYLNQELTEFKLNSIKIKVSAIKKLLPYEEFYPQIQMLKLAQQFSSSYASTFYLQGSKKTFRTVLAPLYAPGIGFNSIKAGIGMPYAIAYTSSATVYADITSSISNASNYYQKLPWETILYPYKNVRSITSDTSGYHSIFDADTDIKIDSTGSLLPNAIFNNIYDRKANNFYAEVVNFFKKDKTLTALNSKPSNTWYFPDLTKKYSIDLVINKTKDYYTYSSLESYGPKPYAFHNPPWASVLATDATSSTFNSDLSLAPYYQHYSAESFARITFDPSSLLVGSLDYGIQGRFNVGDVIRNSNVEVFSNVFGTLGAFGDSSIYSGGNISSSSIVQLTDIVDVFNVASDGLTWQPKLKWECPTADLNFQNLSAKLTNSSGNDSGENISGSAIRGIWHQYTSTTSNDNGLFLSVRNSNVNTSLTGSLLDVVGFDPSIKKKVGKIADSGEINEALVLIPFYQDECGTDKYFDIETDRFEKLFEENVGIVAELKVISRKYNLPPALDFIKFREKMGKKITKEDYGQVKSPCLMFGFEFATSLTQQDLVNIWQGVMPDASTKADIDYQEKEFFIGNYLKDLNFKLPSNTRFKIFKVKQKAISNYQQVIDKTNGTNYIDINYGYNWPYDYCSLVEMAEVKAQLTYGYDITEDNKRINTKETEMVITSLNFAGETGQMAATSMTQQASAGREANAMIEAGNFTATTSTANTLAPQTFTTSFGTTSTATAGTLSTTTTTRAAETSTSAGPIAPGTTG